MTEDLKEPAEVVECEHERCVVVKMSMFVEFRRDGEIDEMKGRDLFEVHGTQAMQVFLDMLAKMQESVFDEADWVMEEFHLPQEVIGLVLQGAEVQVKVMHRE